jgi:hypothetical protein
LNTDLLNKDMDSFTEMVALLKLNEMRSLLKWGILIRHGFLVKG